jgi:hypothetical protein
MIWATKEELQSTLAKVRNHCEVLLQLQQQQQQEKEDTSVPLDDKPAELPEIAPGAERDLDLHKDDEILTDPITLESFRKSSSGEKVSQRQTLTGTKDFEHSTLGNDE